MEKHQLYLEFPEITNEGLIQIKDVSVYSTRLPFDCATLEITPPGYSEPTVITGLTKGFNLNLNACQLGILSVGCSEICPTLPEGIYHFRFSVSPNSKVYVEYNMLYTVVTMNRWYKTLCWINDRPCSPTNDQLELIRQMQLIESQLITAKHLVEDKHDYTSGVEMLRFVRKKLDNLSQGCSNC